MQQCEQLACRSYWRINMHGSASQQIGISCTGSANDEEGYQCLHRSTYTKAEHCTQKRVFDAYQRMVKPKFMLVCQGLDVLQTRAFFLQLCCRSRSRRMSSPAMQFQNPALAHKINYSIDLPRRIQMRLGDPARSCCCLPVQHAPVLAFL